MDVADRKRLRRCKAALKDARWSDVLSETADVTLLEREPKLLAVRIIAAMEQRDHAELDALCALTERLPLTAKDRYDALRGFLAADRTDLAWRALSADPTIEADGNYTLFAYRLWTRCEDEDLRATVVSAINRLTGTVGKLEPTPSAYAFPSLPSRDPVQSTVRTTSSKSTEAKHQIALEAYHKKVKQNIETTPDAEVVVFSDVFVDPSGQIWSEDGRMGRPKGAVPTVYDRSQAPHVPCGFFSVSGTRGLFHWFVQRAPMLSWMYGADLTGVQILTGADAPRFELETLRLAGLGDVPVHELKETVFVSKLVHTRYNMDILARQQSIHMVYDRIRSSVESLDLGGASVEKIYVSRQDASRRSMTNELELEAALARRGFQCVRLSELPLARQVALFANAKLVVGPHGAGLSHMVFARPECAIVEILPIKSGTYGLRFNYARLSVALGLTYDAWLERQPYGGDSWTLDLEGFLDFLDRRMATS